MRNAETKSITEERVLAGVRYVVPAAIVVAGLLVLVVGSSSSAVHGALGIIGAGIAVALLNAFYRIGVSGDRDRDAEDAAREFFDRYGRWPGEDEDAASGA